MQEQFTKLFKDFLTEEREEWLRGQLSSFPDFVFKDEDLGIDLEVSFFDIFKDKYDLREIGAETDELFMHYLNEQIQFKKTEYIPKIAMFLNNFNKLFEFRVELKHENNNTVGNINTYYLNPTNKGQVIETLKENGDIEYESDLKARDVDDTKSRGKETGTREVLQSVWGKTRPIILEQILSIRNIYNECITSFEPLFMGVY